MFGRKEVLKMGFVIRSKSGMTFESTELGKIEEQTFETKEFAELALEQIKELYKDEEFYITTK
jgi:hypothetical protein